MKMLKAVCLATALALVPAVGAAQSPSAPTAAISGLDDFKRTLNDRQKQEFLSLVKKFEFKIAEITVQKGCGTAVDNRLTAILTELQAQTAMLRALCERDAGSDAPPCPEEK